MALTIVFFTRWLSGPQSVERYNVSLLKFELLYILYYYTMCKHIPPIIKHVSIMFVNNRMMTFAISFDNNNTFDTKK